MTQFLALLRLELSGILSELSNSGNKQKGKVSRGLMTVVLLVLVAGSLVWFEVRALDILIPLKSPEILLKMLVFASMLMTFVYGFLQVLSRMYFTKDIALLAYLPTRDTTVYTAKLSGQFLYEIAVSTLLILPGTVVYMVRLGFDAALLCRALMLCVLTPILPICLCAVISGALTKVPGFWKHRETVTTVFTVILLLGVFTFSFFTGQAGGRSSDDESMRMMVTGLSSLTDEVIARVPPAAWGAEAMMGNWLSMLLLFAVSAASLGLCMLLFGRNYISEAASGNESTADFKKVDLANVRIEKKSALMALTKREIREMLRTPAYLINGMLGPVIMPTLMTVMMLVSIMSAAEGGIQAVLEGLGNGKGIMLIVTIFMTCMVSLMAGMNSVASTAVSREGKRHGLMMSYPVSARTIVRSKFLAGLFFSMLGVLPPPMICLILIPGFGSYALLMLLWTGLLAYCGTAAGLAIDLGRPKLDWINENQAIKQNMNQILGMLLIFVVLGIFGVSAVVLFGMDLDVRLLAVIETAILALMGLAFTLWLKKASKAYGRIEA